jgi:hypothetical protein
MKHRADPATKAPDPASPPTAVAIAAKDSSSDPRLQGGRRYVHCACTGLPAERSNSGEVEEGRGGNDAEIGGAARAFRLGTTRGRNIFFFFFFSEGLMKPRVEAATPGGGAFSRAGVLKPQR